MHTDIIADRVVAVDYATSLPDVIAAGRYGWVNADITPDRFPVDGAGMKRFRTRIFDFGRHISSDDAVAAMTAERFAAGDHLHGLAYGAIFPDEQRQHPIICLGSSARVHGRRRVVYLDRYDAKRGLSLGYWRDGWDAGWCFLGVQEVSDT